MRTDPASTESHELVVALAPPSRLLTIATCALMALVLLFSFTVRLQLIAARGPYPMHVDEVHLSGSALNILQKRDPNPHFFNYGSLPIYLTAAAMHVGAAVLHARNQLSDISQVKSVGVPYYSHPEVVLFPRRVFAFISVLGMLCATLFAYRAFRRSALLVVTPLVLCCSSLWLRMSWASLNVDVIAAALGAGGTAYLVHTSEATGFRQRVLWPALFCGAITATKYNSALLGVPFLLVGMGVRKVMTRLKWVGRNYHWITGISGVVMVVIGILMITGVWIRLLNPILQRFNGSLPI